MGDVGGSDALTNAGGELGFAFHDALLAGGMLFLAGDDELAGIAVNGHVIQERKP
jgi:hypothetical protein